MKPILSWLFLFLLSFQGVAQGGKLINFLLFGQDLAEKALGNYLQPADEGLMYALTGGWANTAGTLKPWKFQASLITNGTFVPGEKKSWELNAQNYPGLQIEDGSLFVRVPTIFGGDQIPAKMFFLIEDEKIEFESPNGIGLANINLLPSAFFQASLGLPKNFEVKFRYFPKLKIDDYKMGIWGLGLQHQFMEIFDEKIALAGFAGYAKLAANYVFESDGDIILGENENIDMTLDTWTFKAIASTQFKTFNAFIGLGYITGHSKTRLLGSYEIPLESKTIYFKDPLSIGNNVSGPVLNLGGKVSIGKVFSTVLDYTFQGYNNFSLGFEFKI